MDGENTIPESVLNSIDEQIAYHEQKIKDLKFTLKMLIENPPPKTELIPFNAPLTRDLIRRYMRMIKTPVRTIDAIETLYPNVKDEKKRKLIKTLSVIFNIMEKGREITIEKKKGVKGNYYTWVKK